MKVTPKIKHRLERAMREGLSFGQALSYALGSCLDLRLTFSAAEVTR